MKTICVHRINSNGLSVGGDEYYCYDEKRYNLNKCDIICTNKGYFIGKSSKGFTTSRDMGNCLGICVHETVMYQGIVYFKDEESAIKAFKMLTELDKEILFG